MFLQKFQVKRKFYTYRNLIVKLLILGLHIVYSGNLDAKDCHGERFSPESVWSNQGTDCMYRKSYCNEEGQVMANNGTTYSDRTCRCDYASGYDYITKPINKCGCVPSNEDCSCYMRQCPIYKNILSPGIFCLFYFILFLLVYRPICVQFDRQIT